MSPRTRTIFVVAAVYVVAALLVSGCAKKPAGDAVPTKAPFVIGAIFSVTGDNAPLGVPEKETVTMLEKQINADGGIDGHPVKVEYYDDAGKPEQAVQACQELLANKDVVAIVGTTLSGTSLAIAQMCQQAKMPLLSCAASVKIVKPVQPYVFKTAQSDSLAIEQLVAHMRANNVKTVGFINDSNAYGSSGREQWLAHTKGTEIKTVALESFNTSDTDMTSQLTSIRGKNPDAVLCWGTNPGPAIVAQNLARLAMKQPLYMSHGIANKQFIQLARSAAEGVVFPAGQLIVASAIPDTDPQKATLLEYTAAFQKEYQKPPNTFGGHAWDAFMLVRNALDEVGPDKDAIRAEVEKTKDFVGITGVFNFSPEDHNGLTKDSFTMVRIKDGKWTLAD